MNPQGFLPVKPLPQSIKNLGFAVAKVVKLTTGEGSATEGNQTAQLLQRNVALCITGAESKTQNATDMTMIELQRSSYQSPYLRSRTRRNGHSIPRGPHANREHHRHGRQHSHMDRHRHWKPGRQAGKAATLLPQTQAALRPHSCTEHSAPCLPSRLTTRCSRCDQPLGTDSRK